MRVRLRDSLTNLSPVLLRLLAAVAEAQAGGRSQVEATRVDPAVATELRENRVLAPREVAELMDAYRRGATARALALLYGVHRHTVKRHLNRAGVARRPVVKMTGTMIKQARELYEEGWSTRRIGQEFELSASTVCKALKRNGVTMRPPVA